MTVVCSLLATVAALLSKETFRTPLRDLGMTPQLKRQLSTEPVAPATKTSAH
jgi:hypothetical protein